MDERVAIIKKVCSSEQNVSKRHITYDVYIDYKYHCTFADLIEALDFVKQFNNTKEVHNEVRN